MRYAHDVMNKNKKLAPDLPKFAVILSLCAAMAPMAAFSIQYWLSSTGFFLGAGGIFTVILTLALPGLLAVSWRSLVRWETVAVIALLLAIMGHALAFGEKSAIFHSAHLCVLVVAVTVLALRTDSHAVATRISLGAAIGGGSLLGIAVISGFYPDIMSPREWTYRVPGFMNIRVVGQIAAVAALVAIPLALRTRSTLWLAVLFGASLVIFWSGSRGGLFALFFGGLAVLLTCKGQWQTWSRQAITLVSITFIASALLSALLPRFTNSFGLVARLWKTGELAVSGQDPTSSRLTLWSETFEKALESPWIGNGLLRSISEGLSHVNAHNFALDLMFGYGLLMGGAIILTIFTLAFIGLRRAALRMDERDNIHIALVGGILPFALIEPVLFSPIVRAVFAFSLVALIAGPPPSAREADESSFSGEKV